MAKAKTTATTAPSAPEKLEDNETGGIRARLSGDDTENEDDTSEETAEDEDTSDETINTGDTDEAGSKAIEGEGDPQAATGDPADAQDTGISGEANLAGGGDGVTGVTNDGVTNRSNDGSTGTPNRDVPNTQEGPGTSSNSSLSLAASDWSQNIVNRVSPLLLNYARLPLAVQHEGIVPASFNIHDDLGIARGQVLELTNDINDEFGVNIDASEGQNFLLAKDIYNQVFRKLHGGLGINNFG